MAAAYNIEKDFIAVHEALNLFKMRIRISFKKTLQNLNKNCIFSCQSTRFSAAHVLPLRVCGGLASGDHI